MEWEIAMPDIKTDMWRRLSLIFIVTISYKAVCGEDLTRAFKLSDSQSLNIHSSKLDKASFFKDAVDKFNQQSLLVKATMCGGGVLAAAGIGFLGYKGINAFRNRYYPKKEEHQGVLRQLEPVPVTMSVPSSSSLFGFQSFSLIAPRPMPFNERIKNCKKKVDDLKVVLHNLSQDREIPDASRPEIALQAIFRADHDTEHEAREWIDNHGLALCKSFFNL